VCFGIHIFLSCDILDGHVMITNRAVAIIVRDACGGDVEVVMSKYQTTSDMMSWFIHKSHFETLIARHGSWHAAHVQACELAEMTGLERVDFSRGPQ
jgi:UDP-glucose 4-epimerase